MLLLCSFVPESLSHVRGDGGLVEGSRGPEDRGPRFRGRSWGLPSVWSPPPPELWARWEQGTEGPDPPSQVRRSCSLSTCCFVGVSETPTPPPLTSGGAWCNCRASGVRAHLGCPLSLSPADVGPVTLTADPQVFQRQLRELYVQVGRPAPGCWPLGLLSPCPPGAAAGASGHCCYRPPRSVHNLSHVAWGS